MMFKIIENTALQSTAGFVAIQTVQPEFVLPTIGTGELKAEVIAITASILVQVLRWAFSKLSKRIFVKKE